MTSTKQPSIIAHSAIKEHAKEMISKVVDGSVSRQMSHHHHASVMMDEVVAHARAIIAIAEAERAKCVIDQMAGK
jgi:hypothetical protein